LVRETLGDWFDFEFSGLYETPASIQRAEFQKEINRKNKKESSTPKNWFDAFDNLKEYLLSLKKDKVIVFLDELPWMDTNKSNFRTALSSFICFTIDCKAGKQILASHILHLPNICQDILELTLRLCYHLFIKANFHFYTNSSSVASIFIVCDNRKIHAFTQKH